MTRRALTCWCVSLVCVLLLGVERGDAEQASMEARWVTAWGTSLQGLGDSGTTNATVRMIARVTSSGDSVRVRIANTYGARALRVSAVAVGQRMRDARLLPGSSRHVTFDGGASVSIPPGSSVQSDAVEMRVVAYQDLAVSLHIPDTDVRPSQHRGARVTSYLSANGAGDVTADETGEPFVETTVSMFWLKSIDVHSKTSGGAVVAFGDSITDGSCVSVDGYDRWEDWLGVRLNLDASDRPGGRRSMAIVNEGIGGNTVTFENLVPAPVSTPGLQRLDRDVFSHHGVTHVVLFMGTNDIRREASAQQVIDGMTDIVRRVKERGLTIIGSTIIPRHNRDPVGDNTGWNSTKTGIRNEVNAWIRDEARFDGVLDFDRVVRDPADPDRIAPAFDCDGIHPSPRGYYEMGRSVPLELFRP